MQLGENCFTARSTRRENFSPLTPLSITTRLGMPCSLSTQCHRRNLEPGPLNTYRGWLELKRQVRKGEKGITLCMPMQYKKRVPKDEASKGGKRRNNAVHCSGFALIGLSWRKRMGMQWKRHRFRDLTWTLPSVR